MSVFKHGVERLLHTNHQLWPISMGTQNFNANCMNIKGRLSSQLDMIMTYTSDLYNSYDVYHIHIMSLWLMFCGLMIVGFWQRRGMGLYSWVDWTFRGLGSNWSDDGQGQRHCGLAEWPSLCLQSRECIGRGFGPGSGWNAGGGVPTAPNP